MNKFSPSVPVLLKKRTFSFPEITVLWNQGRLSFVCASEGVVWNMMKQEIPRLLALDCSEKFL